MKPPLVGPIAVVDNVDSEEDQTEKITGLATMGQKMVSAFLNGNNNDSSIDEAKAKKFEKIQPLMSIFSGDMLAKANKVN